MAESAFHHAGVHLQVSGDIQFGAKTVVPLHGPLHRPFMQGAAEPARPGDNFPRDQILVQKLQAGPAHQADRVLLAFQAEQIALLFAHTDAVHAHSRGAKRHCFFLEEGKATGSQGVRAGNTSHLVMFSRVIGVHRSGDPDIKFLEERSPFPADQSGICKNFYKFKIRAGQRDHVPQPGMHHGFAADELDLLYATRFKLGNHVEVVLPGHYPAGYAVIGFFVAMQAFQVAAVGHFQPGKIHAQIGRVSRGFMPLRLPA